MENRGDLEVALGGSNIFDQLISLLSRQKDRQTHTVAQLDEILVNIQNIRNILNMYYPLVLEVERYKVENLLPTTKKIIEEANLQQLRSNIRENNMLSSLPLTNNWYKSQFDNTLYIYSSYLYNAISSVLEVYLNYIESFSFVYDKEFIDGFSVYIRYLLKVVTVTINIFPTNESIYYINGNKSRLKSNPDPKDDIDNAMTGGIDPVVGKILSNVILPFLKNPSEEPYKNALLFKSVLTDNILELTKEFSKQYVISFTKIYGVDGNQTVFTKDYYSRFNSKEVEILDYNLNILVSTNDSKSAQLFEVVFYLLKTLESIKGVDVEIINVSNGSLITWLKLRFKDIVAKEETKTIMKVGAEIALKKLGDISLSETNKNFLEASKLKEELDVLKKEVQASLSIEQLNQKNELGLEKERLENEKLKKELRKLDLENLAKEVEIIKNLSEVFAKGIIQADQLEISLNDLPLFIKKDGKLEIGDIDQALK